MNSQYARVYDLNCDAVVPPCVTGKAHKWVDNRKPSYQSSCWHEDRCEVCGVRVEYDTSD